MKNKPSEEENKLFEDLTSGEAGNLFLMAVEVNGVETTCIFTFEDIPDEERIIFAPVAILVNEEMARQIKLPEKFDELTLPKFDIPDEGEDDNPDENDPDDPFNNITPLNLN